MLLVLRLGHGIVHRVKPTYDVRSFEKTILGEVWSSSSENFVSQKNMVLP